LTRGRLAWHTFNLFIVARGCNDRFRLYAVAGYISSLYCDGIADAAPIAVLIFRLSGILGKAVGR
jgi:hypothetical protein